MSNLMVNKHDKIVVECIKLKTTNLLKVITINTRMTFESNLI